MTEVFSESDFVNVVGNQSLEVDYNQIENALECLKTKPGEKMKIYLVAEPGGRTKGAAKVGFAESPVFRNNVSFDNPTNQPSIPGRTIYDALPVLGKDYDKILFFIASQSGTKVPVIREVERIERSFESHGKSDNVDMLYITGNTEGKIANFVKKNDGKILRLKGTEGMDENDHHKVGFLGDVFELETAAVTKELTELTCNNSDAGEYFENTEKHFHKIGRKLDEKSSSIFFGRLANALGSQTNGFGIGEGGGGLLVVETARTRWDHLKRKYLNSGMYVMGGDHNPPPPLPGNKLLGISRSGAQHIYEGTEKDFSYALDLCKMSKQRGTENFCIIGTPQSPMQEITPKKNTLLIKDTDMTKPCNFYVDALLANSVGAIKTVDQLIEKGVIEKYIASVFKEGHQIG